MKSALCALTIKGKEIPDMTQRENRQNDGNDGAEPAGGYPPRRATRDYDDHQNGNDRAFYKEDRDRSFASDQRDMRSRERDRYGSHSDQSRDTRYDRSDRQGSYLDDRHGAPNPDYENDRFTAGEHRGKGPKGYKRSDERIREDVCDRLADDDHLDATHISVAVNNGEVTLEGSIGSRRDKRRAEDCAESISGVSHCQNNLRVGSSDDAASAQGSTSKSTKQK
tara:strand:- start:68515 stop:69183 length:669 start_codon:yes stop_codon:yes gene_type:complete